MTTGENIMRKRLYLEVYDPLHFVPWYGHKGDCHVGITMKILVNRNAKLQPRECIKECWADK
jgi:hypothetical protein